MKKPVLLLVIGLIITAGSLFGQKGTPRLYPFSFEYNPQRTLLLACPEPDGYTRVPLGELSKYQVWLTNIGLRNPGKNVHNWEGQIKLEDSLVYGVLDISIGTPQQKDADLPLYLRWIYYRVNDLLDSMSVVVSLSDTISYPRWLNGVYRLLPRGQGFNYEPGEGRIPSQTEFYRCLELAMGQLNNKNLLFNVTPIANKDIMPGDVFIQFDPNNPDSSGHTAMIFDVCRGKTNTDVLVLAGWSGDPPHSVYLPRDVNFKHGPWMSVAELQEHLAEFGEGRFYRFK